MAVNPSAPPVTGPDGTAFVRLVDPGWHGTIVIESEGTNEGLADLQARVGGAIPLFPMKTLTGGRLSGERFRGSIDASTLR